MVPVSEPTDNCRIKKCTVCGDKIRVSLVNELHLASNSLTEKAVINGPHEISSEGMYYGRWFCKFCWNEIIDFINKRMDLKWEKLR